MRGETAMITILSLLAAYYILMRWVLPKFGVST
jgi:hypothetical protein